MPGLSNTAMDLVLNYYFRRTAPAAPPTTTYWVLYNGDPEGAGTVAPGFAPVLVNNDGATSPYYAAPDAPDTLTRRIRNAIAVAFGAASANAGLVNYVAIHTVNTGLTAANRIASGLLTTPKTIELGDTFSVPINGADIRVTRT